VHSAAIHLLRGVRKEDERTGVGPARLSALSVLVFAGPMWLTELARIEQVKPPTMTKVVAGLEAGGLVRRRPDPGDARAVRLEATARGTKLLQAGRRRRVARLSVALQALAPEELDVLGRAAVIIDRISPML
jgi:DNA-binding MarR family transcriptional regulator